MTRSSARRAGDRWEERSPRVGHRHHRIAGARRDHEAGGDRSAAPSGRLGSVSSRRPLVVLVAVGLALVGCTEAHSSAATQGDPVSRPASTVSADAPGVRPVEAPLPTIELQEPLDIGTLVVPPIEAPVVGVEATVDEEQVDTIVMIGDSITVASTAALEARFAELGFAEPVIVAQVSKRIAQQVRDNPSGAALAAFLTADDEIGERHADELWIVALGTNDIGQSDPEALAAAVDAVLAEVPADAPLVWVDTYYRDRPEGESRVNRVIGERISARGNAVVAPWSFFAGSEGVLRSDGIHPSEAGTEVFAAVVAETVARFLDRERGGP